MQSNIDDSQAADMQQIVGQKRKAKEAEMIEEVRASKKRKLMSRQYPVNERAHAVLVKNI